MDLPKDCIVRICLEMDVSTLKSFIKTSKNSCVFTNIYKFKHFESDGYQSLMYFYKEKQRILNMLENIKPDVDKVAVLGNFCKFNIRIRVRSRAVLKNYKFYPEYNLYVNNEYFDITMCTEDPNIKLEKLRQLIYN